VELYFCSPVRQPDLQDKYLPSKQSNTTGHTATLLNILCANDSVQSTSSGTCAYRFKHQWSLNVPAVQHPTILRSAHTVSLCVLGGSQNKQRLFLYTAFTDWVFFNNNECLLRGTDWVFKSNSADLGLKNAPQPYIQSIQQTHSKISPTSSTSPLYCTPPSDHFPPTYFLHFPTLYLSSSLSLPKDERALPGTFPSSTLRFVLMII
jgi:hypothetical protein